MISIHVLSLDSAKLEAFILKVNMKKWYVDVWLLCEIFASQIVNPSISIEHPRWYINGSKLKTKAPTRGPNDTLINAQTTELYVTGFRSFPSHLRKIFSKLWKDTQMVMAEIIFARKYQHSFAIIVLPVYILALGTVSAFLIQVNHGERLSNIWYSPYYIDYII